MTQKINGHVAGAEFVGGNVQFYTVAVAFSGGAAGKTLADLVPTKASDGSTTFSVDVNKTIFDVAVEAIQGYTTPVIQGSLISGNLSFRFASNYVVGTSEGGSTDPKVASALTNAIDSAITAALVGQGLTIAAGDVVVTITKSETL